MFHTARFLVNILIVGFFIANLVKENAGCNTLLEVIHSLATIELILYQIINVLLFHRETKIIIWQIQNF